MSNSKLGLQGRPAALVSVSFVVLTTVLTTVLAPAALTLLGPRRAAQAAPTREIVIAHEVLREAGEYLPANLERLLRRIEEVAGFAKGSLRGRAFVRPAEALAYIREHHVAFAILPAHQYLEGRQALKLEVLGRAVGLDGTPLQFVAVTRRPRPFGEIAAAPGLRIATTETHDPAWLALLTEGDIDPRRQAVSLLEVPSSQAALDALLAKQADLAIVHPLTWNLVKQRADERSGGDLDWVSTSPKLPPSAFLAVGKYASAADRKQLAGAVDRICKTTGAEACARMGILYVEAGRAETYADAIAGYDGRK